MAPTIKELQRAYVLLVKLINRKEKLMANKKKPTTKKKTATKNKKK